MSTQLAQALKERLKNTQSSLSDHSSSTSEDQNRPTTSNFNELRKKIERSFVPNIKEDNIIPEVGEEDDGYAQMSPRHALSSNIQVKTLKKVLNERNLQVTIKKILFENFIK